MRLLKNKTDLIFNAVAGVVLFWLCYLAFFKNLGLYSLRTWDESRNAVSVLEMVKSNNWLVTTYLGQPDLWNTKPPMLIWAEATSVKIFGFSELSLRLPSAVAATATVLLVYWFGAYGLKRKSVGLLAALMLLSAMGFSDIHAGRSGDFDAMLVLWTTAGFMATFLWLHTEAKKWLWLAALLWSLAVLTKSTAGLFFWPGIGLYLLLSGKIKLLWTKRKEIMGPIILWILLVFSYYLIREKVSPGYLSAVWVNDIWGRFSEVTNGVSYGFGYYWDLMRTFRLQFWVYFWPVSIIGLILPIKKEIKSWLGYSWCLVTIFFIIISMAATKQLWYELPMYPLVVLTAASLTMAIVEILPWWLKLAPMLPVLFYLQRGVRTNLAYISRPDLDKNANDCQKYGYLFREYKRDWRGIVGVHGENFCSPVNYYFELNNIKRIELVDVKVGDKVLSCHRPTLSDLRNKFTITEEQLPLDCQILDITMIKKGF